jgi:hypothetical protein
LNLTSDLLIARFARLCLIRSQVNSGVMRPAMMSTGVPMRKRSHAWLDMGMAFLGAVLLTSDLEAQARPGSLVGTWRVVRYCDRDSTGAMVEPPDLPGRAALEGVFAGR